MIESDKFLLILPVKQRKSSVLYHELAYRAYRGDVHDMQALQQLAEMNLE